MEKQWTLCCRDSQESSMVGHKLIAPNWKTRSVTFHLEISPSISHLLISTPKNDLVFSKLHLLKVSISRRIKVFGHSTLRGVRTRLRAWTPPSPLYLLIISISFHSLFYLSRWFSGSSIDRGGGSYIGERGLSQGTEKHEKGRTPFVPAMIARLEKIISMISCHDNFGTEVWSSDDTPFTWAGNWKVEDNGREKGDLGSSE